MKDGREGNEEGLVWGDGEEECGEANMYTKETRAETFNDLQEWSPLVMKKKCLFQVHSPVLQKQCSLLLHTQLVTVAHRHEYASSLIDQQMKTL